MFREGLWVATMSESDFEQLLLEHGYCPGCGCCTLVEDITCEVCGFIDIECDESSLDYLLPEFALPI